MKTIMTIALFASLFCVYNANAQRTTWSDSTRMTRVWDSVAVTIANPMDRYHINVVNMSTTSWLHVAMANDTTLAAGMVKIPPSGWYTTMVPQRIKGLFFRTRSGGADTTSARLIRVEEYIEPRAR